MFRWRPGLFSIASLSVALIAGVAIGCEGLRVADTSEAGATSEDGAPRVDGGRLQDGRAEPGARGSDATPGDATVARSVEILASGVVNPVGIALAGDTVFFTLHMDQAATVRKVKKDASGSAIVCAYDASSGLNALGGDIVVVGSNIVWVNETSGSGLIQAAPTAGGPVRTVKGPLDRPYHLATHGAELFWVDHAFTPALYGLYRVPLTGGAGATVESGQIRVGGIAADATGVYWTQAGALANGKIALRRQPAGGTTKDLYVGSDNGEVGGLALGPDDVFWADTEAGRVLKVAKDGGVMTVLAEGLAWPMQIALDGTNVYFTQHGLTANKDGKVSRVPLAGGPVEDLATSLDHPLGIAIDATHVYWTSYGGGEVARIVK